MTGSSIHNEQGERIRTLVHQLFGKSIVSFEVLGTPDPLAEYSGVIVRLNDGTKITIEGVMEVKIMEPEVSEGTDVDLNRMRVKRSK
ncbi:MAG: hypothetical protein H6Q74_3193 [Firmicutes bacterium]|nr:hypothetical protein [Bacillota bacterium]